MDYPWGGWPFPSPGGLPNPVIEPKSPALQANSLPAEPLGKQDLFILFTYFLAMLCLCCCMRAFSSRGATLHYGAWASYCGAFLFKIWNILKSETQLFSRKRLWICICRQFFALTPANINIYYYFRNSIFISVIPRSLCFSPIFFSKFWLSASVSTQGMAAQGYSLLMSVLPLCSKSNYYHYFVCVWGGVISVGAWVMNVVVV